MSPIEQIVGRIVFVIGIVLGVFVFFVGCIAGWFYAAFRDGWDHGKKDWEKYSGD